MQFHMALAPSFFFTAAAHSGAESERRNEDQKRAQPGLRCDDPKQRGKQEGNKDESLNLHDQLLNSRRSIESGAVFPRKRFWTLSVTVARRSAAVNYVP